MKKKVIRVRVSEKFQSRVDDEAENRGMNRSDFVRFALENQLPKETKNSKGENKMTEEKIIREFVKGLEIYRNGKMTEENKKHFDKFDDRIRIGTHSSNQPTQREDYFIVSSNLSIENAGTFFGSGSHYTYAVPGDLIVSIILTSEGEKYIKAERMITPESEDMSYADDYETELYPNVESNPEMGKWIDEFQLIVSCEECGKEFLYDKEGDEKGLYCTLQDNPVKILCRECGLGYTIGEYLESVGDEKMEEYLLNYSGLSKDDPLIIDDETV